MDERWSARDVWPGNVPSRTEALEALRGRLITVVALPGARRLGQQLNAPERAALAEEDPAPLLREATVMRWRLAAARDLLPRADGRRDPVALRAMLVEAWRLLDALRSGAPDSPEWDLAMDCAGEKLQREALAFTQEVKEHAPPSPAAPPPRPRTLQVVAAPPVESASAARAPLLLGLTLLLGLSALDTVSPRPRGRVPPADSWPGAAPHTFVLPQPERGTLLVRSTLLTGETPEQHAWLRHQQARGLRVTRLGPGSYLVAPGGHPPPVSLTTGL